MGGREPRLLQIRNIRHEKNNRPLKLKITNPKLALRCYVLLSRISLLLLFIWLRSKPPCEKRMPLEFKPKHDKIVELLLYLAHRRPGADKYQAVKFFYLADREHFVRYGRPITNETYYALSYGPVASTVLDLLNGNPWAFRSLGLDELPFETELKDKTTIIGKPNREIRRDIFSKTDLAVFDEVVEKHKDSSFDDLFKATHEHYAWSHAWNTRRQGKRAVMYYDEMIDDEQKRAALLEDLLPVASKM